MEALDKEDFVWLEVVRFINLSVNAYLAVLLYTQKALSIQNIFCTQIKTNSSIYERLDEMLLFVSSIKLRLILSCRSHRAICRCNCKQNRGGGVSGIYFLARYLYRCDSLYSLGTREAFPNLCIGST